MIPKKDEWFNAYTTNGIRGSKGFHCKVRGGPFRVKKLDNNFIYTYRDYCTFRIKDFTFEAVPATTNK